ncbi:SNAP25 homologous protein SNAP33 [Dichanthelium oligosanthes]|uniref:SNAP25 homologous protein SNAP33 n=1 Tax=Dichanthelium oligosanthes TaxID=888268 RepID=A0A1E5WFH0_9POAL|nr:SNAP25 homologous protein SNAP33 [Dichanthelium oligosanthes]
MSGKRSFYASKKKATNPFDSDSDDGDRQSQRPARASSVPPPAEQRDSLFGAGAQERGGLFSSSRAPRNSHYRNDFRDAGGLESQSVQELEGYAAYKAEETTRRAQGCVRIAEEMRDTASKTLVTVHQQGQQIHRTHMMAVDIDQDLSRSEKLLGDLGGLFSKKWKPKKNGTIRGPMLTRDDSFIRKGSHLEQRQKLGLADHPPRSNARKFHSESTSALEKVEMEKAKQDDALSDLSNILTELKGMAVDMGSEIERCSPEPRLLLNKAIEGQESSNLLMVCTLTKLGILTKDEIEKNILEKVQKNLAPQLAAQIKELEADLEQEYEHRAKTKAEHQEVLKNIHNKLEVLEEEYNSFSRRNKKLAVNLKGKLSNMLRKEPWDITTPSTKCRPSWRRSIRRRMNLRIHFERSWRKRRRCAVMVTSS